MNENNLWSGSELELLVILLEQEGFTWDSIVDHVAEDNDEGKACIECRNMLYSDGTMYKRERRIALAWSEQPVRPTGFPTNNPSEASENQQAHWARNYHELVPF